MRDYDNDLDFQDFKKELGVYAEGMTDDEIADLDRRQTGLINIIFDFWVAGKLNYLDDKIEKADGLINTETTAKLPS